MRALSPKRRLSITKNTNYPSVATLDRRPSEYGQASQASFGRSAQELDTNRQRLEKIHIKSITTLDSQRRVLERSMLAYTEKMKELNDYRTNNLFRGIQIRMSTGGNDAGNKQGPRSLPASVELNDVASVSGPVDSAKLRRRRRYSMRKHGSLSERSVVVRTPIQEEKEPGSNPCSRDGSKLPLRPTSADVIRRNQNARIIQESVQKVRYSSPAVLSPAALYEQRRADVENGNVNANTEFPKVNINIVHVDNCDNLRDSTTSYPTKIVEIMTKPKLHVVSEDRKRESEQTDSVSSIRRERSFCDSDSAYSSCQSDDDSAYDSVDHSETEDINGNSDVDRKAKHSVRWVEPNPEEGYLLTVPKLHKRKRRSVSKKEDQAKNKNDTLLKKAILKNATSVKH